ncbi:MAG: DNA polymerase Y family protein [Microcella sp.]|uniref:DNA polymerase Y family protein n=1 Tax=Microcella sp. TaxID=1913979 RepID=UPI0024CCE396|nr:DNA polymerase Y family protein [Microcella sp.]UYN84303.1 MAG: DNA polymerase Y family protein [Microcella sp.]
MQRTLVLWVPDWPVIAAVREGLAREGAPVAVMAANRVVACSPAARSEGVRAGQRRREAQSLCTSLVVVAVDEGRDHRLFAPLIDAVEALVAGVQVVRPGLLAIAARGPAGYYGGERAAAIALRGAVLAEAVHDVRIGVADGPFAAELAARTASPAEPVRIVAAEASASFLAEFSVTTLGDPELATLLGRLGVRTLGDFAALPADAVRDRFGAAGAHRHALAGAADATVLVPRTPPPDLERVLELEPPLDRVDQLAFAVRQLADELVETLTSRLLVATAIRIGFRDEHGTETERAWLHPRSFRASEIVDRVRWQLSGETRTAGALGSVRAPEADRGPGLRSAITRVRIVPESVDDLAHHEPGLWGTAPDERVHHALSRVQSLLGHDAVLTAQRGGGRTLAERTMLVPWGDRAVITRPRDRPWPGALPLPAPATVFPSRHAVTVVDAHGAIVSIDDRMRLSAAPAGFAPAAGGTTRPVASWAGPWPLDEQWWSIRRRRLHRLQVVDAAGVAWLLVLEGTSWWAEARYD